MCTYLKPYSGTYYFRRTVPGDIRHLFPTASGKPRTEWRWSLRVKDREAGKRLLPPYVAKTNAMIDRARQAMRDAGGEVPAGQAPTVRYSSAVAGEMERASLKAAEFQYSEDQELEWKAENDPTFALELELRAAKARELREITDREQGRELAKELSAKDRIGLLELFDLYAAIPGRTAKTMAQWRPYLAKLAAFIGDDNAQGVNHSHIQGWRNHLRDNATYRDKRLSAKTINDSYLGAASALFAWAKDDGLIARNPMLEIRKVKMPKVPRLRSKELTQEEALTILRASLVPATDRSQQNLRDAKRWCPWLMAYSGARVNEITQLRVEDIFELEGVAVMRITPEAGPVKAKVARIIPLHTHLIEQGFLEFVAGKGTGPLFYDPANRRSDNAINRQANRLGSKLAEWVGTLGISGVKPNHAWRHLFNTLAVTHELDQRATMAILGHASGNVNQDYGSVPVAATARAIEKLPRFETAP